MEGNAHATEVDRLRKQCKECKLGEKPIGPKSGCEVRKKLVIDDSVVAWKHRHLFLYEGRCKMFQPKKASIL